VRSNSGSGKKFDQSTPKWGSGPPEVTAFEKYAKEVRSATPPNLRKRRLSAIDEETKTEYSDDSSIGQRSSTSSEQFFGQENIEDKENQRALQMQKLKQMEKNDPIVRKSDPLPALSERSERTNISSLLTDQRPNTTR